MNAITLVLGGARSGKSRYAEGLAARHRGARAYVATAEIFDAEMRARIDGHRRQRGEAWQTHEAPLDLAAAVAVCTAPFILIDCLTVWLGNLMHHDRDVAAAGAALLAALRASPARIVIVSNEVGLGIVPDNALARRFRDAQGRLNQEIAALADEVVFVAAGLPLVLKSRRRRAGPAGKAGSGRGRRA